MGRRLRTQLPVLAKTLTPRDLKREREEVAKKEEIYGSNQRQSFNQQNRAKELPYLTNGDSVWIRDQDRLGKIQGRTQHPRSFIIEREKGTLRRNRSALVKAKPQSPSKVDKQATFASAARDHAVQDTEGMTGPSKLPWLPPKLQCCLPAIKWLHYKHIQGELLSHLIDCTSRIKCLTLFSRQLSHLYPSETVLCTSTSCEHLALRF